MLPQKSEQLPRQSSLWFSVLIILLIYGTFGWMGGSWQQPLRWAILLLTTILINMIAVSPYRLIEILFTGIFGANLRSLMIVMACSTLVVVLFTWLPIVYYATLMLAATLILSMDLYERGWRRLPRFCALMVCQMVGLGIGFGSNLDWLRIIKYLQSLPHS